jgi:hypothetical protein
MSHGQKLAELKKLYGWVPGKVVEDIVDSEEI